MKPWLILTLIAAAILYALALDPLLDLNLDTPRFVMLGRSIHDGQGYFGRFDLMDQPETQITYLYPLILSSVIAVAGPEAYGAFKIVSLVSILLALWAAWFWMSQWTTADEARWIVILAAFLTQTQLLAGRIATEAPFLAASFACMGFMERVAGKPSARARDWAAVILLIGVSFHLRAAGWSLLATFFVALLLRRNWKTAFAGGALGLAVCSPWLIRTIIYGLGYSGEFEQQTSGFFAVIHRIAYNGVADIAKSLPDLFFYPFFSAYIPYEPMFFLKAAVGGCLFLLMVAGLFQYLRQQKLAVRDISATTLYFVIYTVGALSWTVHGERYLLPVLPLLIWALLRGAGRWRPVLQALILAVGIAGCLGTIYRIRSGIRPAEETGFREAVQWVKTHVSPADRVTSRYPTWVAAVAGNRGFRWTETTDTEVLRHELIEYQMRWLIVDLNKTVRETGADLFNPLIERDPAEFQLAFESAVKPSTRVYRFTPH